MTNPFCPLGCHEAQESRNPDEIDLDSGDSETETTTNPGDAKQLKQTSDETVSISGCTEEDVVWSIQRQPGLNLPPPTNESHVTADEDHVTTDEDHVTAKTNKYEQVEDRASKYDGENAVDSHEESMAEVGEHSGEQCSSSKPVVVIKRRNQPMYTQDEKDKAD